MINILIKKTTQKINISNENNLNNSLLRFEKYKGEFN